MTQPGGALEIELDEEAAPTSEPPLPVPGPPLDEAEAARRRAILSRPELLEALLKSLSKCRVAYRNDILNTGVADALAAEGFPPDEGDLVFDFVARKVKNARHRFYYDLHKHGDPVDRQADLASTGVPIREVPSKFDETMEVAERLAAETKGAARGLALLKKHHLEGATMEEAAAELGMKPQAAYKASKRFIRALQAALGLAMLVVAWLFAPGLLRDFLHPNAHDLGPDHGSPEPVASTDHVAEERAAAEAKAAHVKELVDEALAACGRKDWRVCASKLGEADALDPRVEDDARVKAARPSLEDGLLLLDSKGPAPRTPAPTAP